MRQWFALLLVCLLVQTAGGWRVQFAAHENNVGVQIDTQCWRDGKLTFQAVDYVHVDPAWSDIELHRPQTPKGASCTGKAYVFRNTAGGTGNPDEDTIADQSGFVDIQ